MNDLDLIGEAANSTAIEKGFYYKYTHLLQNPNLSADDLTFICYMWRASRIMLIVTELSEAVEAVRKGNISSEPGSNGYFEELADAQIRLSDLAESEEQLESFYSTVREKMKYNSRRPHMHGGKIA